MNCRKFATTKDDMMGMSFSFLSRFVFISIMLLASSALGADLPSYYANFCGSRKPLSLPADAKEIEELIAGTPYTGACSELGQFSGAVSTKGLNFSMPAVDLKDTSKSSKKMMREFIEFLERKTAKWKEKSDRYTKCSNLGVIQGREAQNPCKAEHEWIKNELPLKIKEARSHLSLAYSDRQLFGLELNSPDEIINYEMENIGFNKAIPWKPATTQERAEAKRVMDQYGRDIRAQIRKDLPTADTLESFEYLKTELRGLRHHHLNNYRAIMATSPYLNFIESENPSHTEITQAFQKTSDAAAAELKNLAELKASLDTAIDGDLSNKVYDLLYLHQDMDIFLEIQKLKKPPQDYCAMATVLHKQHKKTTLVKNVGLGLVFLGVGIFAPPLAGGMAAAAGGTAATATAVTSSVVAAGFTGFAAYDLSQRNQDLSVAENRQRSAIEMDDQTGMEYLRSSLSAQASANTSKILLLAGSGWLAKSPLFLSNQKTMTQTLGLRMGTAPP